MTSLANEQQRDAAWQRYWSSGQSMDPSDCFEAGWKAAMQCLHLKAGNGDKTDWSTYEGDDDMPYDPEDGAGC